MDDRTTRRSFVGAALLAGGGVWLGPAAPMTSAAKRIRREPLLREGAFRHGVAAGVPGERSITLWTRVSDLERSGRVRLEVARDEGFSQVVHRQTVRAAAVRDFTARATITPKGLQPGERYFYRFETAASEGPVGRFKTAPAADSREPVKIGFFSCQDWGSGYYNAHRGLAAEDDLDLVVCLGDYTYERVFYEGPADRRDTTGANGDGDVQTLAEYRTKYQLYRSDPDLLAMHAAHPFVAVWDDHEVEDNWAAERQGGATPEGTRRVDFLERRRGAFLSFFEWMPRFRLPADPSRIYERVRLGRTADLLLLDTRQYRDDQPCGDQVLRPCAESEQPGRTLLGADQKRWFLDAVTGSPAQWKVVGNQVMIMSLDLAPGAPVNPDQWDGYGAERREVLGALRQRGVRDLTFITGDIHTFFAGDVHVGGRVTTPAVGTEFVGGSLTSLGFEDFGAAGDAFQQAAVTNPHLKYVEGFRRGYGVMTCARDGLDVRFRTADATVRGAPTTDLARFRVRPGVARTERVA